MTDLIEVNFDGLVGPTHNFAGLSLGNIASLAHSRQISYPKKAALQGLEKMMRLSRMGLVQGVFPPQERPHLLSLKKLGFKGTTENIIKSAAQQDPKLLINLSSASSMWVANAGTTSSSADTQDQKTHFTAANLSSMLHRSIEHHQTSRLFKTIFSDEHYFHHHDALPGTMYFGDEGAANHTRFCKANGQDGLSMFVYGHSFQNPDVKPVKYPARQSLEASMSIARQHQLPHSKRVFVQQNPQVIDQGVFHNDVIAVGSRNILFCHEQAFVNQTEILKELKLERENTTSESFYVIEVKSDQVSVENAVKSYLFNTQIIFPNNLPTIIAPQECQENPQVLNYLNSLLTSNAPIQNIEYFDLRQSMNNGGGPACLRFRVMLNSAELESVKIATNTLLTEKVYHQLKDWIHKHYRDELKPEELFDSQLYVESCAALDELTRILKLGNRFYDFQQ